MFRSLCVLACITPRDDIGHRESLLSYSNYFIKDALPFRKIGVKCLKNGALKSPMSSQIVSRWQVVTIDELPFVKNPNGGVESNAGYQTKTERY